MTVMEEIAAAEKSMNIKKEEAAGGEDTPDNDFLTER